jgi:hypothetical protein
MGTMAGHAQEEKGGEGKREGGVPPRVGKKEDKGERVPCRGVHDQVTCFRRKRSNQKNWRKKEDERWCGGDDVNLVFETKR